MRQHGCTWSSGRSRAFTLVEALVVVAITALLIGILLPTLGAARDSARAVVCMSNQRQLALAWLSYTYDEQDCPMPYSGICAGDGTGTGTIAGRRQYWWGIEDLDAARVDTSRGFLGPDLDAQAGDRSVFECPSQHHDTYAKQGQLDDAWTSTYGYNAYYLSPSTTGHDSIREFKGARVSTIRRPTDLFVFGDTMLILGGTLQNTTLLDPPQMLTSGRGWKPNMAPTTSFRHAGATATARADGHVATSRAQADWIVHEPESLGSVGLDNGPHYVPDWATWESRTTR